MKRISGVLLAVIMLLSIMSIFATTSNATEDYELIELSFTNSAGDDIAEIKDGMKVSTKIKNNSGAEKKVGIRVLAFNSNGAEITSLKKNTTKANAKTTADGATSDTIVLTLGAVKTSGATSLQVYVITYSGASASLASGALYEFQSNPNYLNGISVDGNAITDYSDSVDSYNVLSNSSNPTVVVEKGNESQTVTIDDSGLPGSVVITVTPQSGSARTITLNFINDSTSLSYIKVDGKAIENLSDGQDSYAVSVDTPYPYIEIGKSSNTQTVVYEKLRLPAEVKVTVTAQSGRERVISLKITTTQSLGEYKINDNMLLWVNSANNKGQNATDTDAATWKDLSGNGNDFKISGKWTQTGLKIKANEIKNVLPDAVKNSINGNAFTIKFRLSGLNAVPNSDLPIIGSENGLLRLYVPKNSNKIYFRFRGAKFTPLMASVSVDDALNKENAITVDSDYIKWYIDGVQQTVMPVYDIKGGLKKADNVTLSYADAVTGGAVVLQELKVFDKALSYAELNADDVINSDPTVNAWYSKVNSGINICARIDSGEDSYTVLSQDDNLSFFFDEYTAFHSTNAAQIAMEMSGYFSSADIIADYASYEKLSEYAQKALRFVKSNKGTELTGAELLTAIEEIGDSSISALTDKVSDEGMSRAAVLLAENKPSNYTDYIDEVKTQLVLSAIAYPSSYDWVEVAKIITDYSTYLGIDVSNFNKLSDKSKANVAKEVSANKPTKASDVAAIIRKYSASAAEPISAGGGGGGGGGIPAVTPEPINNSVSGGSVTIAGFSDMQGSEWAKDALSYMVEKGFISGISDKEFAPKRNITRGEFVAIITRCELFDMDDEYEAIFDDITEDFWGYKNIIAAYKNGIISGVSERVFDPNGEITRQDMAVVLYNAYAKQSAAEKTDADFSDWESVSDYAKDAVGKLHALKILNGYEGEFLPNGICTRAEAVQAIYSYQKALNRD